MLEMLFPNWMLFAGIYLFLKIYNPTRLYFDNTTCLAIGIVLAMGVDISSLAEKPTFMWVISVVIFAFFVSVPYMLSGMVGGIMQQLLLLNEQSVQDKRFTDESEALSKMSSITFLMMAVDSGAVFYPMFDLATSHVTNNGFDISFYGLLMFIVECMKTMAIVASKYIILLLIIALCCGYIDLFFKNASFSMSIATDLKAIAMIVLMYMWFISDQSYVFNEMMKGLGYHD